jgi:plastocyanin
MHRSLRRASLARLLSIVGGCSSSSTPAYVPTDAGTSDASDASGDASDAADASSEAGGDAADASGDAADASGDAADAADAAETGTVHTVQVGAGGALTFSPSTLTIAVGDTVTWSFAMAGHTVTSGTAGAADDKFCSPSDTNCGTPVLSAAGDTYSHRFTTAGAFPYFCAVHFASGMVGTITVTP